MFRRDGYKCKHCGSTSEREIDHKKPIASGGTNELDNLQVLCRPCNARKGDMPEDIYLEGTKPEAHQQKHEVGESTDIIMAKRPFE